MTQNEDLLIFSKRIDSTWNQQTKLLANDGDDYDKFGWSVSLYDEYALIGSKWDDDNGSKSGSAYIFKRNGSTWSQKAKLTASDGSSNDYFGSAVSLYKDYALISAIGDIDQGGAAYIFKRTGSTWIQQDKIFANDIAASDLFGYSVSLYKDYALIGTPLMMITDQNLDQLIFSKEMAQHGQNKLNYYQMMEIQMMNLELLLVYMKITQ